MHPWLYICEIRNLLKFSCGVWTFKATWFLLFQITIGLSTLSPNKIKSNKKGTNKKSNSFFALTFFRYLLKRGTTWNDLKRSATTWNDIQRTGNDLKRPTTSNKQETTWNDPHRVRHNLQRSELTNNEQKKDAKPPATSRFWDYFTVWERQSLLFSNTFTTQHLITKSSFFLRLIFNWRTFSRQFTAHWPLR